MSKNRPKARQKKLTIKRDRVGDLAPKRPGQVKGGAASGVPRSGPKPIEPVNG